MSLFLIEPALLPVVILRLSLTLYISFWIVELAHQIPQKLRNFICGFSDCIESSEISLLGVYPREMKIYVHERVVNKYL